MTTLIRRMIEWARHHPCECALVGVTVLCVGMMIGVVVVYSLYRSQQAALLRMELEREKRLEETRTKVTQFLVSARQYETAGKWWEAKVQLEKVRVALQVTPDLRPEEFDEEIQRRLKEVQRRLNEQQQMKEVEVRWRRFQQARDDALFHVTAFTGLDPAINQVRTREAARQALSIYGLGGEQDPDGGVASGLERDRPFLKPQQCAQLAGECYEMLVILAETEAASPLGSPEPVEQVRKRAEKALALLDRAARLGKVYHLDSEVYHIRKARYEAQLKGEQLDRGAAEKVAPQKQMSQLASIIVSATGQAGGLQNLWQAGWVADTMIKVSRLDWALLSIEKYQQNQFAESIAACDQVIQQQNDDFWGHYIKALGLLRQGRWWDARAELTVCLNLRPDFVWPRLLRGFAASELGLKFKGKVRDVDNAEFQAAAKDFDEALEQDRDKLVQYVGLTNRGALNIRRGRYKEAIRDLEEAVKVYPEGVQAYSNLAQALQGDKQWDKARAVLDKAIELAPGLAMLYDSRSKLHLRRGEPVLARNDLEKAINLEPENSRSQRLVNNLVELGRLLHREQKYQEALARYDRALRLMPEFVLVQRFRAETLLTLGRNREAGEALDDYLKVTPDPRPEVCKARGLLYASANKPQEAIEMYTLALRQDPHDLETRCLRGWTYLLTDGVQLALGDFEACLRDDEIGDEKNARYKADALAGRGNARIRLRAPATESDRRRKLLMDAIADGEAAEKQSYHSDRLLYNVTGIYAQAVAQLKADHHGKDDAELQRQIERYETKALDHLQRVVEEVPEQRRKAFWASTVTKDPALEALRQAERYRQLEEKYGK